jgi:hypothetical protein
LEHFTDQQLDAFSWYRSRASTHFVKDRRASQVAITD